MGPWSPIHLLSILTLVWLVRAIMLIRRRNVLQHARIMKMVYLGGLVIAGFFTFMPGRIMHAVLFGASDSTAAQPVATAAPGAGSAGLLQIVSGTPLWVWPLLAYVLWRGWRMSRDRDTRLRQLVVMPLIMLGLSLYGLVAHLTLVSLAAYLVGAGFGAAAGQAIARRRPAELLANGMIRRKGDWLPFALVVGIFAVRYTQGITLALHPALAADMAFILGGALLSGLFAATMVVRTLAALPPEVLRERLGLLSLR